MNKFVKAAVVGHPVSHSKSPLIHNYWIEKYGLNGAYEAIDTAPENLEQSIRRLVDEGFTGFNVTVPHKEAVLTLCDEADHNARAIGAVNTVVIKDGKLRGLNTDGFGFLHNIWEVAPDFEFQNKRAVILGAGGAARAIISGLIGEEIGQIVLTNRTREKAEKIKDEMGSSSDLIVVEDWENRNQVLENADLLVNTTSLGMNGQPPLDINLNALPKTALVNDIVYAPLQTDLLKAAKENGNIAVTGIGMLIHQARPAFKAWFGVLPDVTDELRELVLK
ncbi:MAG: shikimate dehydrogenase [Alphaproteobacteria bacterium]